MSGPPRDDVEGSDLERSPLTAESPPFRRFTGRVRSVLTALACGAAAAAVALARREAKPSRALRAEQLVSAVQLPTGSERCDMSGGYGPCTCGPYICGNAERCINSSCNPVKSTICADEDEVCMCPTVVKFGDGDNWSEWRQVSGSVLCSSNPRKGGTFPNMASGSRRSCYCANEQQAAGELNNTWLGTSRSLETACARELDMLIKQKLNLSEADCVADCLQTPLCAHASYSTALIEGFGSCFLFHTGCKIKGEKGSVLHTIPSVGGEAGTSSGAVVFYHLYQPDPMDTRGIVKEQIQAALSAGPLVSEVRYITVAGPEKSTYPCSKCRKLAHFEEGFEELTLQYLYDHCVQNGSEYVVYMHNKGSFHSSDLNMQLRQFLLSGVFSEQCLTKGADKSKQCDVCSSRFSPFPHPHMPGNMWAARCDYIARLRPPSSFAEEMDGFVNANQLSVPFVGDNGHRLGTGRYANECWVASHPDVEPCDVYDGSDFLWGYFDIPTKWSPSLQHGMRLDVSVYLDRLQAHYRAGNLSLKQLWQWRLLEWSALYNISRPSASSWAWKMTGEGQQK